MNTRTKTLILFLILILTAPAFAQQPRIDSIFIDESKGILNVLGEFDNPSSALVYVDSVILTIVSFSNNLISANIPLSGSGSCGSTQVIMNGKASNTKLITYFHFQVFHQWVYFEHNPYHTIISMNADTIHIRCDVSSYSQLSCSKLSRCHDLSTFDNPLFDTSGVFSAIFSFQKVLFEYPISYISMSLDDINTALADVQFDENYQVNTRVLSSFCSNGGECFHYGPIAPTDFPPSSSSVRKTSTPNILQANLSSDPFAYNAEVIVTLRAAMNVRMEIVDILGHVVFSEEKMLSAGENRLPISSASLLSGIYICRLQAGGEVVSVRFVKE